MYNTETFKTAGSLFKAAAQNEDHRLSGDLAAAINAGKIYYAPKTHFVKREMTDQGGKTLILDPTTDKVAGISSIQGDKLPKKEAMCYNGVRIMYGKDTEAGKEGEVTYNKKLPEALLNANLIIKQNGRTQIDIPVLDTQTEGTNTNKQNNFYELPASLLRDDEEITVEFQFPKGVSMPDVDHHYVALFLRGVVTR